jgi:TonB family protein
MSRYTRVLAALLLTGVAGCAGAVKNETKAKEADDDDPARYGRVQLLNLREPQGSTVFDREWEYASFVHRVRNDIAKQWHPMVRDAMKQRDPDGSVYFYRERTVVLSLVLDTSGNVKDMTVKQSSNVDFFDRIAMNSVRNAQRFSNPPSEIFHGDEQVTIPFSFTMFPHDRNGGHPPAE